MTATGNRQAGNLAATATGAGKPIDSTLPQDAPLVNIVTFDNLHDVCPRAESMPWPELVTRLSIHDERDQKDGPLFSAATYRPGATRSNAGVESLSCYVADIDHARDWGALVYPLADYEYVIFSTFSYTPEAARYRVILPFAREVSAADWPNIWPRVNVALFGGLNDPATKDVARFHYLPSCPPHALRVFEHHQGEWLDPYGSPEFAAGSNGHKRATPLPGSIPKGQRNATLTSLAGTLQRRGASVPAIEAALAAENQARCDPPLDDAEVLAIARSVTRYAPAVTGDIASDSRACPAPIATPTGATTLGDVLSTYEKYLYLPDPGALYVALAATVSNLRPGTPVWLLLVAPGGYGKTEIISPLGVLPQVWPVGTLTEASLLSGTATKDKSKDARGGLLCELGQFGIILCKDFGSILSLPRDPRAAVLAALREIFDGSWTRRLGTDGGKALSWAGKVGFIGGCTPSIDQHHAVMSALGERFCLYRVGTDDEEKQAAKALQHADNESEMRRELGAVVAGLFATIDVDRQARGLSELDQARLISLSSLAARCRSAVVRDSYRREIDLIPGAEAPTRLTVVLSKLLAGLELIGCARDECWRIITKVALDSMPQLRRAAFEALLLREGASAQEIALTVGNPTVTVRRALEDLACYGVVDRVTGGRADYWRLTTWARQKYEAIFSGKSCQGDYGILERENRTTDISEKIATSCEWEAGDDDEN